MSDTDGSLQYPMRLVAKMTGLTADTIRAWERRYRAIAPDRSEGNTRRFSAEDVKRLTLLREATQRGHSIASIAGLDTEALARLVNVGDPGAALEEEPADLSSVVRAYLDAVTRFEDDRAFSLIRRAAATLEPRTFALEIVAPIVAEVGDHWAAGSLVVAQEHLVTIQLMALMAALPVHTGQGPRILLALPPHQRHMFGLLIGGLLARLRGARVVNLGADVPFDQIGWAIQMARPAVLVSSIVCDPVEGELETLVAGFTRLAEEVPVWIGCPADHALVGAVAGVRYFHAFEPFDVAVSALV